MKRWMDSRQGPGLHWRRVVWFSVGITALALGAIGVVLPILPTTPFVIFAAFSFGKSSPKLQRWLENSHTFGPIIMDWRANGAIAPRYKAIAVAMMSAALGMSIAIGVSRLVLVVQCVCMTVAATYVLSRPSRPRAQEPTASQ